MSAENTELAVPEKPDLYVPKILFVDDEEPVLKAMKRFSRGKGWQVLTALSAAEGLAILASDKIDVVVSDMRMPNMSGDVFLAKIKELYPEVMRILLTGYADLKALENAINNAGIYNYINKPWDDNLLSDVIQGALRFQESERERARLEALTKKQNRQLGRLALSLDKTVKERTIEIEQALTLLQMTHDKSKKSFKDALAVVTHLLDWNEGRANNHCRFVAEFSEQTAKVLKLSVDDIEIAQTAGLLHDIGLMALPEKIRKKPVYDMTPAELADYQQHPILAEMALSAAPGLELVARAVKQHHEQINGKGFPDGISGDTISMPAKVVAVVADYHDYYHGLLEKRCLGHYSAKAALLSGIDKTYDKKVVNAFLTVLGDHHSEKIQRFKAAVSQLKEGMILDQDLHAENRLLLLTEGTVITRNIIDRLLTYQHKFKCKFEVTVKGSESA